MRKKSETHLQNQVIDTMEILRKSIIQQFLAYKSSSFPLLCNRYVILISGFYYQKLKFDKKRRENQKELRNNPSNLNLVHH